MGVHSTPVDALEGGMQTETAPETLPIEAGDAEWVAGLFDTLRAGDVDAVVDQLDELVRVMRKAAKARRMLATVEPSLLRQGLVLCNSRTGASR
jgi:hypothetical protein